MINEFDKLIDAGVTVIEYFMSDWLQYIEDSVNYSIVTLPEIAPIQYVCELGAVLAVKISVSVETIQAPLAIT